MDARFDWQTNIDEVAGKIQQGLNRINAAIKGAQGQAQSTAATQLAAGVTGNLERIQLQMQKSLQRTFQSINQGMIEGRNQQGLNVRSLARAKIDQAAKDVERLSKDIGSAIKGTPLEAQGPQIQQAINQHVAQMKLEINKLYARITQSLREAASTAPAGKRPTLDKVTVDPVTGQPRIARGAIPFAPRTDLSAGGTSEREISNALERIAHGSGLPKSQQGKIKSIIAEARQQVSEEIARAERVLAEIRANRNAAGGVLDPRGARGPREGTGGAYIDAQGRRYFPTEEGGLRPAGRKKGIEGEYDELTSQEQMSREESRRENARADALRKRAAQIELETAQRRREQVAKELVAQSKTGGVILSGKEGAPTYARDAQGRFFKFDSKGGAEEVKTPRDRVGAQRAILAAERRIQKEMAREAEAAKRNADAARARRTLTAAGGYGGAGGRGGSTLVGGAGGFGSGGPRGGLQGVFDQAFGGQKRGLGASDILSTGFNFSRYMISAAAFAVVFKAVAEVKEAILDYQDSLKDLEIALDSAGGAQESFLDGLANISRLAGENAGAAFDVAARGIRVFSEATDSLSTKEDIGLDFTRNVAELAVIAGKDMKDAGGDLTAVATDFDVSFSRMVDAVAVAKNEMGGDPGEISQGMAAIATAAREAGFSVEETAAIVARVSARTDSSGRSVGTRLARALGIVGSTGRPALAELNKQLEASGRGDLQVGLGGTPRETIIQLAELYTSGELDEAQKGMIRSKVGGTANTREFMALLNEMNTILGGTADAYSEAGEGTDQFNVLQKELNKTLARIAGSMKNIIVELTDAGFVDIFVAALHALDPFLFAIQELLTLYNKLPRVLKTSIALTLEAAAAYRLYAMYAAATTGLRVAEVGAAGVISAHRRTPAPSAGVNLLPLGMRPSPTEGMTAFQRAAYFTRNRDISVDYEARAARRAASAARRGAGFTATGFSARGMSRTSEALGRASESASKSLTLVRRGVDGFRGALNSIHPVLMALAGVFAIQQSYKSTVEILEQLGQGVDLASRVSAADVRGEAQSRLERAAELRESSSGFFGSLSNLVQGRPVERLAEDLERQGAQFNEVADAIEKFKLDAARQGSGADAIDVTAVGGIEQGLSMLENSGRSATSQVNALDEAIKALGDSSRASVGQLTALQRVQFENVFGVNLDTQLQAEEEEARAAYEGKGVDFALRPFGVGEGIENQLGARDSEAITREANKIVSQFLAAGGSLDEAAQIDQLIDTVFAGAIEPYVDMAEFSDEQRAELKGNIRLALAQTRAALTDAEDPQALVDEYIRSRNAKLGQLVEEASALASLTGDPRGGGLAGAQRKVTELRRTISYARSQGASEEQLEQTRVQLRSAEVALIGAINSHLDVRLKLATSLLAETLDIERMELKLDTLRQQLRNLKDADEIRAKQAEINDLDREIANALVERANAERLSQIDPRDALAQAQAAVTNARASLDQIHATGDGVSKAHADATTAWRQALQGLRDAMRNIVDAAGQMFAFGFDDVSKAAIDLRAAERALADALPGQAEWYAAYAKVLEAQFALAQANAAHRQVMRISNLDVTNPVELADAEVQAIADTIDVLQQARAQIVAKLGSLTGEERESALAAIQGIDRQIQQEENNQTKAIFDAEKALFDQRLGDFKTDLDLGRITRAEYIAALEEMLANVEGDSRQAKEMRDQIELALKALKDEMDGQWNLGDIRIPTPFEVRRAIKAQTAGLTEAFTPRNVSAAGTTYTQTVTIQIDGTDIQMVRKVINDALGPEAFQSMTAGTSGTRRM